MLGELGVTAYCFVYFHVCKGKKNELGTDKKPEESVEHKVTSSKETKENKPATNKVCFVVFVWKM